MQSVVLLVLIASITGMAIVYMVLGHNKGKVDGDLEKRLRDIENQLQDVNKRLENVETITTDKSWRINQEFENLKNDR